MGQQIRTQYDPDADPEIEFEKPAALAQSLELNLAEKRDALMRWDGQAERVSTVATQRRYETLSARRSRGPIVHPPW